MDRSSQLKEITLRLFMQALGLLLILFGVVTITSFFNRLPGASFRDIRDYFILIFIAGAAIVAGYKLVRLDHTGRQWAAMVILAIVSFMIVTTRYSLTEQRSKFGWEIWTFHGELSSANAASYYNLFDKIPFVVLLLGFCLIGFLASGVAKNTLKDQANSL
jgi:hypothetical protein